MDGREPARPPHDDRPRRRSLPREAPAVARRLATPRVLLASAAVAVAAGLLLFGPRAARSARAWLHDRPEHRLAFRAIELVPPPPDWIVGGSDAVLDRIRRAGRWRDPLATLDVVPEELRKSFVLDSPWIAAARVRVGHPNRVRVEVEYREPVARVQLGGSGWSFAVDASAVVLPKLEIDPTAADALPIIRLPAGTAPGSLPPGTAPGPAWDGLPLDDRAARSAAELAAFLRTRRGEAGGPINVLAIAVDGRGRWLQNDRRQMILWDGGPAAVPSADFGPDERWEALKAWANRPEAERAAADYEMTPSGVVPRTTVDRESGPRSRPVRSGPPRADHQ